MDAIVVFESMWGNTAAVALAIAEGLGADAVALVTDEATPERVAEAALVVAGAPVHALTLPSENSRAAAAARDTPTSVPADVHHPSMRDWLSTVPPGPRHFAAFETRIAGPLGRGAAFAIGRSMSAAGYTPLDRAHGFTVTMRARTDKPAAMLLAGQEREAHEWGQRLRTLLVEATAAAS
ncbi:flavodoxin family protein [Demequina sp.]|uniref:flavodoxin family protein n=1 Tax=Demequina sp. TaxID=2050685 RepID=UPI003A8C2A7A